MLKVLPSGLEQCLDPITMLLVEGFLKQELLDNYLIKFCGVCNFGNKSAMRVTYLTQNFSKLMKISKMQRKMKKKFFVSQIIVSELVALNCVYLEENTS